MGFYPKLSQGHIDESDSHATMVGGCWKLRIYLEKRYTEVFQKPQYNIFANIQWPISNATMVTVSWKLRMYLEKRYTEVFQKPQYSIFANIQWPISHATMVTVSWKLRMYLEKCYTEVFQKPQYSIIAVTHHEPTFELAVLWCLNSAAISLWGFIPNFRRATSMNQIRMLPW